MKISWILTYNYNNSSNVKKSRLYFTHFFYFQCSFCHLEYEPVRKYIKIIQKSGLFELSGFRNFEDFWKKMRGAVPPGHPFQIYACLNIPDSPFLHSPTTIGPSKVLFTSQFDRVLDSSIPPFYPFFAISGLPKTEQNNTLRKVK